MKHFDAHALGGTSTGRKQTGPLLRSLLRQVSDSLCSGLFMQQACFRGFAAQLYFHEMLQS